jgi:glycosyltransferase involved in cell wall biosynthesis
MSYRVLFIVRNNLYSVSGGDTIQIQETAKALALHYNIKVEIEFSKNKNIDYSKYNLLHFFNIFRPADILPHIKKANLPFVVSPIFVDYGEYEKTVRSGIFSNFSRLFPPSYLEYLKTIIRAVKNGEDFPCLEFIITGQEHSIKKIMIRSSALLPNSQSELNRLKEKFQIDFRNFIVPNAVNTTIFNPKIENIKRLKKRVICVARVEELKNQMNLIMALNGTSYELLIIGNPAPNHIGYYKKCKEIAKGNVKFISKVTQPELVTLYASSAVHILPSWFETTGLSSLEAAVMGCNLVLTKKGDTYDYFGDLVEYCEPNDISSIKNAVLRAQDNYQKTTQLKLKILNLYTWEEAAKATYKAYLSILK